MSLDEAVKSIVAGKISLIQAEKAMRGKVTVGQLVTTVKKYRAERAAKIGRKAE